MVHGPQNIGGDMHVVDKHEISDEAILQMEIKAAAKDMYEMLCEISRIGHEVKQRTALSFSFLEKVDHVLARARGEI